MKKQLQILKALSHPVRLNIIYALKDSDFKCVCHLQELVESQEKVSQSSLSQHLKILRDAGIVETKKVGGWVHYSLENKNIIKILEILKEL
ncbi:ArsR/SmtB family transcription factor [Cetobacterium sp.]|uniref:ArsR/SmtB family transcription factor n=1 Tax=Cetobacterium sp. TaxID=2071632 RepID=UPI002FC7882B